jgi:hypothetical protein
LSALTGSALSKLESDDVDVVCAEKKLLFGEHDVIDMLLSRYLIKY